VKEWTVPRYLPELQAFLALHRIVKGVLTKNIMNFSQNVVQVL